MAKTGNKRAGGGVPKKPGTTAVVPVEAVNTLARVPISAAGEIEREGQVVRVMGIPYLARGELIPASEIYFDGDVRPAQKGPWLGEADKIAWRDPASGYECIILRAANEGFLGGYVSVPSDHPLYGFKAEAVPADIGIEVHGGLTYAAMCQEGPSPGLRVRYESRRICHVAVGYEPIVEASDYRIEDRHAWWFGFTCDGLTDVVPGNSDHARRGAAMGLQQTYRDDAYVYGEVVNLAAQLRAVANGEEAPPRDGATLPPRNLDPRAVW